MEKLDRAQNVQFWHLKTLGQRGAHCPPLDPLVVLTIEICLKGILIMIAVHTWLIVSLHIIGMNHVKNTPSGGSSFSHGNANAPGAGTNPLFCHFFRKKPSFMKLKTNWSW